ncbi:MAG: DNA polymerase I, partial [Endomicrobia bacterium]|nr:DNA polymerase I [Endomicrobiia bacterium]
PNRKISSLQELVDVTLGGVVVAEPRLPNEVDIELFPVEKLILRLVDTLDIIYKIYEKLEDKIMANQQLMEVYKEIDLPMVNILVKMENNGILVDQLYIKNLQIEIETKIKESKNKIFELAGLQFNLNSPKQLSFVLFDKLKLPPIKKKKTGYSTDEEVLQKLKGVHPIVSCILQYRELEKLLNTYIQPLLNCVNPNTNRIHTTFNLTGTATGRLSSENPNMQNIPVKTDLGKKIRQIFIPEEKFKFVSLDYSQIELRILAHLSQDKNLIQAFLSHKDIHKLTAVEIFGINESQVDEQLRRIGKVINFGIIYGITPQGLSKELNISLDVAENYISKYFQRYSEVKEWIKQTIKFAKLHGYVKTLFGRIRPIPEINSTNKQISSFGERLAINTPVQGTAADIIKLAMIKIDNYIKTNALRNKVKMLLQIHDELLFEIHNEVLDVVVKQLKDIMENVICLNVPLEVDITISERWGKE